MSLDRLNELIESCKKVIGKSELLLIDYPNDFAIVHVLVQLNAEMAKYQKELNNLKTPTK